MKDVIMKNNVMSKNKKTYHGPQIEPLTENKVKEIIIDALIELELVPQPQKRKQISNV
jgi:hypothetical protein